MRRVYILVKLSIETKEKRKREREREMKKTNSNQQTKSGREKSISKKYIISKKNLCLVGRKNKKIKKQ